MKKMELKNLAVSTALVLLVTGCATSQETITNLENAAAEANNNAKSAQASADDAKRAADAAQISANDAQGTANAALSKANEALDTARMALEKSEANQAVINELDEKIDRMFKKTMHK